MSWFDDLVHHFQHPSELPGAALRAGGSALSFIGNLPVVKQIGAADRAIYSQAIARPVAAGDIALNPQSKDFLNPGAAWNDAQHVSPAQAALANPFMAAVPMVGPLAAGVQQAAGLNNGGTGFDPTNPALNKAVFQSSLPGKVLSGVGDTAFNWYTDPLVLGGHALGAANKAVRVNPVTTSADIAKQVEQVTAHAEMNVPEAIRTPNARITPVGSWLQTIVDKNTAAGDYSTRVTQLMKDPVIAKSTDPAGMASLMARADNYGDASLLYRAGIGDLGAKAALDGAAADLSAQVSRMSDVFHAQQQYLAELPKVDETGNITHAWEQQSALVAQKSAELQAATQRDQWLAQAVGNAQEGQTGAYGALRGATPVNIEAAGPGGKSIGQVLNDARTARAEKSAANQTGYWGADTYPSGPMGTTVKVLNWLNSEVPIGHVYVKGDKANESFREVQATLRAAKADPETTAKWIGLYAKTVTPSDRASVLAQMEEDLVNKTVARHNALNPDATPITPETAKAIYQNTVKARQSAIDSYKSKGYLLDDNDHIIKVKQFDSQLEDTIPMMDFKLLDRYIQRSRDQLAGHILHNTQDAGTVLLGTFNQFWKPAVLLRLGYTTRNVGESQLAAFAKTGFFVGNPMTGTKNLALNVYDRLKDKVDPAKLSGAQGRQYLLGQIDDMTAQRAALEDTIAQQSKDLRTFHVPPTSDLPADEAAYAAQAQQRGTRIATADVQAGVASPSKSLLPSRQRARYAELQQAEQNGTLTSETLAEYRHLHAKAARKQLREMQAEGQTVAYRNVDGQIIPADNVRDIPDEALFPHAANRKAFPGELADLHSPGARPEPDVFLLPKFSHAASEAVSAGQRVDDLVAARLRLNNPGATATFDYSQQALANMKAADQQIATLEQQIENNRAILDMTERKPVVIRRQGEASTQQGRYTVPGMFGGPYGDMARRNLSMESSNEIIQHTMDPAMFQYKFLSDKFQRTNHWTKFDPGDRFYFDESARIANTVVRSSELGKRLVAGQTPAEIAGWMTGTAQGRGVMRELELAPDEVLPHVQQLARKIDDYYPDGQLQRMIADGPVTPSQIQSRLAGRTDLRPVHGQELQQMTTTGVGQMLNRIVTKAFHVIGTLPEDNLTRFPLANVVYRRSIQAQLTAHMDELEGMSQQAANDLIAHTFAPVARQEAVRAVRHAMYTVDRRTTPAEALRFISPFFQVTQNRMAYYGSQLLENPQNMARLFLGWNAIHGQTNKFGDSVVTVSLPGPAAQILGLQPGTDLQFNKQSINLMFQGEPWWSPGWGPPVTVPLAHFIRSNPEKVPTWLDPLVKTILPTGPGLSDSDMLLPTTLRRIQVWMSKDQSPQWANTYALIAAQEAYRYSQGLRPDKPTNAEIQQRTDSLWLFRTLAAATLPAQPTIQNPLQPMIDTYQNYQQKFGQDANAHFLQDFPQYFDYVVSLTRNPTAIAPNLTAVGNAKKYNGILPDLNNPAMTSLVTNNPADTSFDTNAYQWEKATQSFPGSGGTFRQQASPQDALKARQVSRGWTEYSNVKGQIDALVNQYGFTSINDPRAVTLKAILKLSRDKIAANNPDWWFAYSQQDNAYYTKNALDLQRIVTDPTFVKDQAKNLPWIASAQSYLQVRAAINRILQQRGDNGLSANIAAKSNLDLLAIWDLKRKQLADTDPQWSDIANRFFANDNLSEVPQ